MADLENATPFGACVLPSSDCDGRDLLLIVIAAQFALPEPGDHSSRLTLFPTQDPPPMGDEHVGAPGSSSLRSEGQSAYTKPATDICVWGDACAPQGRPVTAMTVSVRVGPCAVDMRVYGDREWLSAVTIGARPSDPAPFVRVPLVWERAYGGVASASTEHAPVYEPRNPIGCGLETDADAAVGKPVPNIEHPRQILQKLSDRPQPVGVTPVARHWQPRISYAGSYDEVWRRERAPLWPLDFNERFFCSAPEYLQASPHLSGGEPVILQGLHPDGDIGFRLPTLRLGTRSRFTDRTVRTTPTLDGVVIEMDVNRLTMYYRAVVPAYRSIAKHYETLVRLMAPWEEPVEVQ
jgi:hypothetical protein